MEDQNSFDSLHSESHTPIYIWIILVILLLGLAGVVTLYFLQTKQSDEKINSLQSQIVPLRNDVAKLQQEKTDLNNILEERETKIKENNEIIEILPKVELPKTLTNENFSVNYPENYTLENNALWNEEDYKKHTNPPSENCDVCHIPTIKISTSTTDNIEEYILKDNSLNDITSLKEIENIGNVDSLKYSNVKIGKNNFIKLLARDMRDITTYYIKNNDTIISFKTYSLENDNDLLKNILSTLKFE